MQHTYSKIHQLTLVFQILFL